MLQQKNWLPAVFAPKKGFRAIPSGTVNALAIPCVQNFFRSKIASANFSAANIQLEVCTFTYFILLFPTGNLVKEGLVKGCLVAVCVADCRCHAPGKH